MQTLTENRSLTYDSSGDCRLDFLFHAIEGSCLKRTTELLELSWKQSPLDTMKLVMNLRDIRHGKGIRTQFIICLKWLIENQLETLLLNLEQFTHFGCWKDYLNMLLVALFGELSYDGLESRKVPLVSNLDRVILRSIPKEKRQELSKIQTTIHQVKRKLVTTHSESEAKSVIISFDTVHKNDRKDPLRFNMFESYFPEKEYFSNAFYKVKSGKEKVKLMENYRKEYFDKMYEQNNNFKRLYDWVVEKFAVQLLEDQNNVSTEKSISLAAKWLPNSNSYFDKYLFILLPIAKRFFELQTIQNEEMIDITSQNLDSKSIIRSFQIIYTKLRTRLLIPEIPISARKWNEVQYFHVPSKAMLRYRVSFVRNDFDRLTKFIESKGAKGGTLTPGEIIHDLIRCSFTGDSLFGELLEELTKEKQLEEKVLQSQWNSLVEDIKKKGNLILTHCLAVCDVSGSMFDTIQKVAPIEAALGLTLILMELSTGPWSKMCITFSENPSLFTLDMDIGLTKRLKSMINMEAGYSTCLNKVFTLILSHAKENNIENSNMPKVLFIFSDMEFNEAMPEKTNFEYFKEQYKEAGYPLPLVVFWNLKGNKASRSTPVKCQQEGVFLLSGYSAQTLNFFYSCDDISKLTPFKMLENIVQNPIYDCVRVHNESVNVEQCSNQVQIE